MRTPRAIRQLMAALVCAAITVVGVVYVKNIPDSRMPDNPRVRQSSCATDSIVQSTPSKKTDNPNASKKTKKKKKNKQGKNKKTNTIKRESRPARNHLDEDVPSKIQESNPTTAEPTLN